MPDFGVEVARLAVEYGNDPNRGRCSIETLPYRFWAKVDQSGECWTWTASQTGGYGLIGTPKGNDRAHRVSWVMANGPIPDGLHVLHTCDNPLCVRPDHLFLGTNEDNIMDRIKKGRKGGRPRGTGGGRHRHCSCRESLQADNLRLQALAEGLMHVS